MSGDVLSSRGEIKPDTSLPLGAHGPGGFPLWSFLQSVFSCRLSGPRTLGFTAHRVQSVLDDVAAICSLCTFRSPVLGAAYLWEVLSQDLPPYGGIGEGITLHQSP